MLHLFLLRYLGRCCFSISDLAYLDVARWILLQVGVLSELGILPFADHLHVLEQGLVRSRVGVVFGGVLPLAILHEILHLGKSLHGVGLLRGAGLIHFRLAVVVGREVLLRLAALGLGGEGGTALLLLLALLIDCRVKLFHLLFLGWREQLTYLNEVCLVELATG